jgi:thiol-disulfide isomerase/thioredoxin
MSDTTEVFSTAGITLLVAVVVFGVFVGLYWGVRGFLPGSRVYEQDLPGPNDLDKNNAVFRMFYVNWCPHCRDAKPKWDSLGQLFKNQVYTYGGKTVTLEKVNCELEKGKCARYKVNAYPTFKVETDQKVYEYVGPADPTVWRTFLGSALGREQIVAS